MRKKDILGMADRTAKQSESWGLAVLVDHIIKCRTFFNGSALPVSAVSKTLFF